MTDLIDNLLHRLTATAEEAGLQRQRADHLQALVDATTDLDDDGAAKVSRSAVEAVGDHYCRIIERLEVERDEAIAQQEVLREVAAAREADTTALRHRVGVVVDELLNSSRDGKVPVVKLYKMRDPEMGLYDAKTRVEKSPWWARVEKLRDMEEAAARKDVGPWYPDDEDWVEHDGSGPPPIVDVEVACLLRSEREARTYHATPQRVTAWSWKWVPRDAGGDVVAWRRV
ncbi:MAG: hypothetical protein P1V36_01725 [Planctomycetota bacterium]|nr:hypothetical protein [Planctomycetota bacterium]